MLIKIRGAEYCHRGRPGSKDAGLISVASSLFLGLIMLASLVNQYLSIKTREELRARDPVCPRCESRPRHRTAIDERLTSYCTPCNQAIKKERYKNETT